MEIPNRPPEENGGKNVTGWKGLMDRENIGVPESQQFRGPLTEAEKNKTPLPVSEEDVTIDPQSNPVR